MELLLAKQADEVENQPFFSVLCLLCIGMLVLERSNGFEATEQSSYSVIWHNPQLMVHPAASYKLPSVTTRLESKPCA